MDCSGCGACTAICPTQALTMELNNDGFLRPKKNAKKCVDCNLCRKVCPQECDSGKDLNELKLFSGFSENEEVRKSTSSGGVGYCLAKWAISNGYKVCGVKYNYERNCAEHCIVNTTEELEMLKGSKYLQSHCEQSFKRIITDLKSNGEAKYMVLGTPCQIAGLKNILVLQGLRERVILVDIFCHGVPSNLAWEKYLCELITEKKLNTRRLNILKFRDKNISWHTYYMNLEDADGKKYIASREYDTFLQLFTIGAVNQQSCFTCRFRNYTNADIRLGDYWGARYKESEAGVSMVLPATKKGENVIGGLSEVNVEERPIEERLSQQHTDPGIPKFYTKAFDMLRSDAKLKDIVNLYETDWDRLKWRIKKKIKRLLKG